MFFLEYPWVWGYTREIMKSIISRFFRSPLGLTLLIASAAVAFLLTAINVVAPFGAFLLFLLLVLCSGIVLFRTGLGARSVIQERDREREERDARILGGIAAARKRLALLRLPDPEVDRSLQALVVAAGEYLTATVKGQDRDPIIEDAILSSVETIESYLQIKNAQAASSRFHRSSGEDAKIPPSVPPQVSETVQALESAIVQIENRLGTRFQENDK